MFIMCEFAVLNMLDLQSHIFMEWVNYITSSLDISCCILLLVGG